MKKKDLKTGYVVETRKGKTALIVLNNCYGSDAMIYSKHSWTDLDNNTYDNDLNWVFLDNKDKDENDIMKVYRPDLPTGFLSRKNNFARPMTLLWERKEEEPICEIDGVEYSESTLRSLIKKATK